jgi:hypothetical protein
VIYLIDSLQACGMGRAPIPTGQASQKSEMNASLPATPQRAIVNRSSFNDLAVCFDTSLVKIVEVRSVNHSQVDSSNPGPNRRGIGVLVSDQTVNLDGFSDRNHKRHGRLQQSLFGGEQIPP